MNRKFLFHRMLLFDILLLISPVAFSQPMWTAQAPGPNTQGQVENIGDREVVGAVKTIAVHPTNPNIIYIGAVNGGIWKTSNGMAPTPIWDFQTDTQKSLSIGALAFDPTDTTNRTLVAGTGCFSSFGSCGGDARSGLLRTTDEGTSWTAIDGGAALNGLNISGVAPRGRIIVISVNAADDPQNLGVWRSTDGGQQWTHISAGSGTGLPGGAAYDLASDPSNAFRLFTNAGADGLFRSTDAGATWSKVSNATMDGLIARARNVKISVGRANNLYVAIVNAGRLAGVFHSGDSGGSWAAMDLPTTTENGSSIGPHPGAQGEIHLSILADPNNAQLVYVGGDRQPCFTESSRCQHPQIPRWPNSLGAMDFSGRLFRGDASRPASGQWLSLTHAATPGNPGSGTAHSSAPHADSRDMAMTADGVLIEADDGGIYRRTNPQTNSGDWFSMNGNLQTTEFHAVAWDANSHTAIGSAQDIGTPAQLLRSNVRWQSISTGDGGDVAVDDRSAPGLSTRYSSFQNLDGFRRQVYNSANEFQSEDSPPLRVLNGGHPLEPQFYTPIKLNTVDPTRLVIGANNSVYESLDQGDTLTEVGPNLAANQTSPNIIAYGALGNPDILYIGSRSRVFVRTSASPAPFAPTAYSGGFVLGLAIDPDHPEIVYAIDSSRVFRTQDSGRHWTDISGNLQSLAPGALLSITYRTNTSPGAVVVGSDVGVFEAAGTTFSNWSRVGAGLPRAPVHHLDYNSTDKILIAGTLGRGAWTLTLAGQAPAITRGTVSTPAAPAVAFADNDRATRSSIMMVSNRMSQRGTSSNLAPNNGSVFELRSGVVVDPHQKRIFIMSPSGGIDAVELTSGKKIWSSASAAKPLGLVNQRLITQADVADRLNVMKLVILNPATGKLNTGSEVALPPDVRPSVDSHSGEFKATARPAGGAAIVDWEFQARPLQGLRPGTEERLTSPKSTIPPGPRDAAPLPPSSGTFRLNTSNGAASAIENDGPGLKPSSGLRTAERVEGLPDSQIISADGLYVMVSKRTGNDQVWDKYTLTFYERNSGKLIGEIKSHFSLTPFFITDNQVVFETGAYTRKTDAKIVTEPLKIRAFNLKTGLELWSQEVRDNTFRGSSPP